MKTWSCPKVLFNQPPIFASSHFSSSGDALTWRTVSFQTATISCCLASSPTNVRILRSVIRCWRSMEISSLWRTAQTRASAANTTKKSPSC